MDVCHQQFSILWETLALLQRPFGPQFPCNDFLAQTVELKSFCNGRIRPSILVTRLSSAYQTVHNVFGIFMHACEYVLAWDFSAFKHI